MSPSRIDLPSSPVSIKISVQEALSARLSLSNLQIAVRALHRDGLIVVEDAIDHGSLERLNKKMIQDAYALHSSPDMKYNFHKGNLQQDPPMTKEHFTTRIFLNPFVTQITSAMLGPRPQLLFMSGNTAMPPTADFPPQSQPVHTDVDLHPSCPFAFAINVPLMGMTPENGSTEVWLGSHTDSGLHQQEDTDGKKPNGRIRKDLLEQRRSLRGPCQPVVPKGGIVIRDLRLWHNGKPNMSKDPRIMLAMIHFAAWYRNPMRVEFAEELREVLRAYEGELEIHADFLPERDVLQRYLRRAHDHYEFDQAETMETMFPEC